MCAWQANEEKLVSMLNARDSGKVGWYQNTQDGRCLATCRDWTDSALNLRR